MDEHVATAREQRTFEPSKYLVNLNGKGEYLEVKWRLLWLRTEHPDAVIETDSTTLSAVIWNGRDLADALRDGDIRIDGDQRAVTRFPELFARPLAAARE